jgi:hypothetical protein
VIYPYIHNIDGLHWRIAERLVKIKAPVNIPELFALGALNYSLKEFKSYAYCPNVLALAIAWIYFGKATLVSQVGSNMAYINTGTGLVA